VVLETLEPAERLAFVLHDMFAVPFDEIAAIVERSPAAARQLASRARRRVQGADVGASRDLSRDRKVVDAFLAAARGGDLAALLEVLDPDVVGRSADLPAGPRGPLVTRGAAAVARQAMTFARFGGVAQAAIVDGRAGVLGSMGGGDQLRVMAFTVVDDRITEIDAYSDPERLRGMELVVL
jgi:RNA polymerase sigma-70 factor (ECF subfamily)